MNLRTRWRSLGRADLVRLGWLALGGLLMLVTPLVALLPGPGGVFVFAAGLALILKNSLWARKRYVAFKKRWPKPGGWADWGLRRRSARRRAELARDRGGVTLPDAD